MEPRHIEKATSAIADKYRLQILMHLAKQQTMTSSEVQELTGLSQPCVSHHVKQLTDSGLVDTHKEGRNLFLRLNRQTLNDLGEFLKSLG